MIEMLDELRRTAPGEYLDEKVLCELEKVDRLLAARVRAARVARQKEQDVLGAVIEPIFKKFDFSKAHDYRGKCYRDVGLVYRYCVFAMLCDDMSFLENKLLFWLKTILQSLSFPEGRESIRSTYTNLRRESERLLPREDFLLLEPYLSRTISILPS